MSLQELLTLLRDYDTALLANTVGYVSPTPPEQFYMGGDIRSMTPTLGPVAGVAMTLELDSSSPGNVADADNYFRLLEAMSQSENPVILVIKAVGSRPEHECVMGDGMAKMLHSVGCVGVVSDGGVRDLEGILTVPLSVHARGLTIHHTALRYVRYNVPVSVGGISVSPGDIVHANSGGVIKLPKEGLERLPDLAAQMRSFEYAAHNVFRRKDLPVAEKRRLLGELLAKSPFA